MVPRSSMHVAPPPPLARPASSLQHSDSGAAWSGQVAAAVAWFAVSAPEGQPQLGLPVAGAQSLRRRHHPAAAAAPRLRKRPGETAGRR
jgi:hypothetical protein